MLISLPPQSYFCINENRLPMLQQNLTSNQLPVKIMQPSLAVKNGPLSKRNDREGNTCKHMNENGWCSKNQRQCSSLNDLFIKY
jgi:hypothetical protein